jgi:hypothetical protein
VYVNAIYCTMVLVDTLVSGVRDERDVAVPIMDGLLDVIADIQERVKDDEYLIPAQRKARPGRERVWVDRPTEPSSSQALGRLVARVGQRAGMAAHVHPHGATALIARRGFEPLFPP